MVDLLSGISIGRLPSGQPCRQCGNPAGTCADRSADALNRLADALTRPPMPVAKTAPLQADIFLGLAITTTATFNGIHMLRVPTRFWSYVFDTLNLHNQTMTIQLMGNVRDDYSTATPISGTVTLAASTGQTIAVSQNLWAPFMGLQVSFATGPSSGTVTARGYAYPPDFLG